MTQAPRMATRDWLTLAALSVLWGASFLFYRVLAFQLPPVTTVFARVALGLVGLLVLGSLTSEGGLPPRSTWARFVLLGLLNNALPFLCFAWAERHVAGGTASILNAMTPIFTVVVTGLLLRTEAITPSRVAGIACGFAGVAALIGPAALLGTGGVGEETLGRIACLAAAICYAFGVPFARSFKAIPAARMAAGQLAGSTALMLPLSVVIDRPWSLPPPSLAAWASLLGLALLSTSLAYLLFFKLLARVGATNLTLVTFLVPVSALLLGVLVLGERISVQSVAGMALIAAGLVCIDGRLLPRRRVVPLP